MVCYLEVRFQIKRIAMEQTKKIEKVCFYWEQRLVINIARFFMLLL